MNVIWHKVWRDLWHNKFRTFLVVLSTAVGVFALGLVFGLSGAMRAIGATSAAILGVFVVEGVLVGVLSWLLAAPLSYPGARVLSNAVGAAWMKVSLDFRYSMGGLVLWLAIVAVLSALASLWPALRATRVSVWEALAYE